MAETLSHLQSRIGCSSYTAEKENVKRESSSCRPQKEEEETPVTQATTIPQHLNPEEELGERWGARLARLGLQLAHCLLRPFLVSSTSPSSVTVDTRPMHRIEQPQQQLEQPEQSHSSPTKSLFTAVCQRLTMDIPGSPSVESDGASPTNSSSEPSPHAADTKLKSLCETTQTSSPLPPLYTNSVCQDHQEEGKADTNQKEDKMENLKQTLLRESTGSIAIMTRQQEALDLRRHTFSTMSADSRANMRRRSYDFTMQFGSTFPPLSPPRQSLRQPLSHHHLHHLRVYGESTGLAKRLGACYEEGAPLLTFLSPNHDTVWTRGKPVDVKWEVVDKNVEKVRIELLEEGRSATTLIAMEAPNTGFFTYHKVPWGMESGSKYFLRVSAADGTERYRTSSFFQISSSP